MIMLVSFGLMISFENLNYNPNETRGWNGIAWCMLSGYSGPHIWWFSHGMWWLSPEGTLVIFHPRTKRLPCFPCFSELPVQPYDNMGSVLID
jgi:hypothetical protein